MNRNSKRILIYAVVFLAVLNITTLVTIGYTKYITNSNVVTANDIAIKNTQNFNGRYFRDRLGLSKEQMDDFRPINDVFRSNARIINTRLGDFRNQMMDEMQQNEPDTSILNMLSDSIGSLHRDLKFHTYRYYLNIKGICTTQQQDELNKIFNEFFISEGQHNPDGKQRHQGKKWQND